MRACRHGDRACSDSRTLTHALLCLPHESVAVCDGCAGVSAGAGAGASGEAPNTPVAASDSTGGGTMVMSAATPGITLGSQITRGMGPAKRNTLVVAGLVSVVCFPQFMLAGIPFGICSSFLMAVLFARSAPC